MNYDFILVNFSAVLLVLFIVWWFFGKHTQSWMTVTPGPITILVKDSIYQPSYIRVPREKPIVLNFLRKDITPCAETVYFPQLDIAESLPINETVQIIVPPQPAGEIEFTCQMGMYRGKLLVE